MDTSRPWGTGNIPSNIPSDEEAKRAQEKFEQQLALSKQRADLQRFADLQAPPLRGPLAAHVDPVSGGVTAKGKLFMRLGYFDRKPTGGMYEVPDPHIVEVVELANEYAVFLVADGEPMVLRDGKGLFPSDTLIGQIHLLKKK
jgi:hypothetical protein